MPGLLESTEEKYLVQETLMQNPKDAERNALATQMISFLAAGGKIEKLSRGACSVPKGLRNREQQYKSEIRQAMFKKKEEPNVR